MMGAESVAYHRKTVLERGDDHRGRALAYYGSRGETPLVWGGQLRSRIGLDGVVSEEAYSAVFGPGGPQDPASGERLVSVTRPGVELVVSAHKSVAVLGVIGRADDMHAILEAETTATMAFLDVWFSHQGGRRGREQRRTATGGLMWARTRHATSRAGDPNPHDHVLVANVTQMLDERGGWKALDTGGLRDLVHAATMVGRLASAAVAVELGYGIVPDAGPSGKLDHWRIAGIPDEVIEAFSKRSADIGDAVADAGFDSPLARAVAARATRERKRDETLGDLTDRWVNELEAAGWTPAALARAVDRERATPLRELPAAERGRLVWEVLDGPLAERKAFTRADVIRAAAPHLYGYRPSALDDVVQGVLDHPEAIPLVGQPGARGRAWAAASVLLREQAIATLGSRIGSRNRSRVPVPAATSAQLQAAVAAKEQTIGAPLTAGQRRAAEAIATGGNGLDLVIGIAGSGKTTALDVARAALETAGYRVLGTATSGQAARTLQAEAGIESRTIASLVARLEHETLRLDPETVVFIDEAGMTSDADLHKLLAAADASGAKIVAVGDHRQLGAVAPGGGLEGLTARHPDHVHLLEENVRQRDAGERVALAMLRAGSIDVAVDWYRHHDRLHPQLTRDDVLDQTVRAWDADRIAGLDTVMLAWRRRDVAALNHRARQRLLAAGLIHGPELEASAGRRYAAGDRVVALAPSGDGRWVTSQRATVTRVVGDDALAVTFDDGRAALFAGDETGPDRLDHAYAVTVHRTQGATVDTAHLYADGGGRELAYVGMSRARRATHMHLVADDLDQAAADLAAAWAAEHRQRWTLDANPPAHAKEDVRPILATRVDGDPASARTHPERTSASRGGLGL
jgi:conjugative relaxase-like TrwC/TraI family protein